MNSQQIFKTFGLVISTSSWQWESKQEEKLEIPSKRFSRMPKRKLASRSTMPLNLSKRWFYHASLEITPISIHPKTMHTTSESCSEVSTTLSNQIIFIYQLDITEELLLLLKVELKSLDQRVKLY